MAFAFLAVQSAGADEIKKKDGTLINGQILGVSDGAVKITIHASTGGDVQSIFYLSDIDSVEMAPPKEMTAVKGGAPDVVVAALEPLLKEYSGLPADWVVDAMGQLAEAYSAQGAMDRALATYDQIDTQFPGSKYHLQAVAGRASVALKRGNANDAISDVEPIIVQANEDLVPSQSEGGLYATAFLVYGQALEAQKKPEQALEAYLTVKTMFYQNPTLAAEADQLAKKLRDANPGLGVE